MTHTIRLKLTQIMLYVALALMLAACHTNEGDIGYFYGQWALRDMTIDSEQADIDVSKYFWKFQSNIIEIQKDIDHNDTEYCIGTWETDGPTLYLNFTHHDATEGSPTWQRFNPPPELGIPGREVSALVIEKFTSKDLVLSYVDAKGRIYVYTLKKLI